MYTFFVNKQHFTKKIKKQKKNRPMGGFYNSYSYVKFNIRMV